MTCYTTQVKILFVCEGNIYRSQIAGTVFAARMPSAEVKTAGTLADYDGKQLAEVSKTGIELMREIGYDMSSNVIIKLTPDMVEWADKVIVMGSTPGGPLPEYLKQSPKLETWDVPDPGYSHISVSDARDLIVEKVQALAGRFSAKLA